MGIDLAGLRFLRYATRAHALGETVTLGRQEIHVLNPVLRRECDLTHAIPDDPFCEWLLRSCFGSKTVHSMDNSTYENATLIHDNNTPIGSDLEGQFDSVLDFGTLEHIFNIPQALDNCIRMCKKDGLILHYVPANNQCGHGFWQISPELFFSLYSKENGFRETEVFLVPLNRPSEFFRVKKPMNGQRATVHSNEALIVAACTRKDRDRIDTYSVQQSDYVSAWTNDQHAQHAGRSHESAIKTWLEQFPDLYERLSLIKTRWKNRTLYPGLNARNPWLERVDITSDNSGSRA